MSELTLRRILFSPEADVTLKMLKARTGITPNILCRMGFCLSLEEPGRPSRVERGGVAPREINRYTLLGEYDTAFVALLKVRCNQDDVLLDQIDDEFVAHVHRGIQLLAGRMRSLQDLDSLAGKSTVTTSELS